MEDVLLPVLVLVFVFILTYKIKLFQNLKKQIIWHKYVNLLPGDRWFPFVGTAWRFFGIPREKSWDLLKKLTKQYGPTWRMWSGSTPVVFASKVEDIEAVLKHNVNLNKSQTYDYLRPWLGDGLITAEKTKWKVSRKLLTSSFHLQVLDKYGEVFASKGQELVKILKQKTGEDYIDVFPYLVRCALDVISETAMGVKFDTMKRPHSEYANAIFTLCSIVSIRSRSFLLRNDFLFKFSSLGKLQKKSLDLVQRTNLKIITERKKEFQKHKNTIRNEENIGIKEKLAFLDLLLNNQEENKFTENDICNEVSTFMFTGQDTTAVTVTYAMLALGNNPKGSGTMPTLTVPKVPKVSSTCVNQKHSEARGIYKADSLLIFADHNKSYSNTESVIQNETEESQIQVKVHEELDRIFKGEERSITPQDVADMEYLERVIKETLRIFSVVPIVGRTLDEAIEIDGKTIPAGVSVQLWLYEVHHDPKHWSNPEKFDPDRFLPENSANRHPCAYVPFSAGPRNCIGQKFGTRNSKTILACILRKFEISCLESMENLEQYNEIVVKPQNGLHVKFKLRNRH